MAVPNPAPSGPSPSGNAFTGGVENLQYNDPFGQKVHPAWYEGKMVYHLMLNASAVAPTFENVAKQYLFVYDDEFQNPTTLEGLQKQPKVPNQHVVFDSVPGDPHYSAIWRTYWVLVPRSYRGNDLRSLAGIAQSQFPVIESNFYVN